MGRVDSGLGTGWDPHYCSCTSTLVGNETLTRGDCGDRQKIFSVNVWIEQGGHRSGTYRPLQLLPASNEKSGGTTRVCSEHEKLVAPHFSAVQVASYKRGEAD